MIRQPNDFRLLLPTAVTSFLLLILGSFGGWYLYRQQEATAAILSENLHSREAADDLDVVLDGLLALLNDRSDHVEPLHDRIGPLLLEIHELADTAEERSLSAVLNESFQRYRRIWETRNGDPEWRDAGLKVLEEETVPACRKLRSLTAQFLEESARTHRASARWTAAGMAGLGIIGAAAGVIMGYGVARWLRRSIHQLRVRVQDAADKLGHDLPPVEWEQQGDLQTLHEDLHELTVQVEAIVEKLQQREREVWRSKQLAAAGQLATGIVHEIRNPLTSIRMLVQANREDVPPGTSLGEDLQHIEEAVVRMERSLQSFLEFARPPRLRRSEADLAKLIEETVALVQARARQQHVAIAFTPPETPLRIEGDRELLQQALLNLLLNALDVMPRDGTLTIELDGSTPGFAEVRVLDTGPGISPDVLPRLFEPFVTTKETGVGLGLVVSRRIVEDHGGTLDGKNRPGGGACFWFRTPIVSEREH